MKHDGQFERVRRSPSMTLDLGAGAPPQPGTGELPQSSSQQNLSMYANPSVFSPDESLGLPRPSSSAGLSLDGIEPRLFPGVVSKRRRSSLRSSALEDGEGNQQGQAQHPGHSGFRRRNEGSVVEEQDTDDE
jgi:AMP deaminase